MRTQTTLTRPAFTIIEVLIALAVSLLLMLSLTEAFAFISERIRENRTRVELSTRMRSVTAPIQNEIKHMTVPLEPHTDRNGAEGYFVYYEGPTTDVTSTMLGNQPMTGELANYYRDSRYGDFDDYIAFTAYNADQPFQGVVPKYILMERMDETNDAAGDTVANDYDVTSLSATEMSEAIEPVMISSNYAEIIYWVAPAYETSPAPDGLGGAARAYLVDPSNRPVIRALDSPLFPDRLVLHRRVLLIRPDLNLQGGAASPGHVAGTLPQLSYPVGTGSNYVFMQPDPWSTDPGTGSLPQIIRTGGMFGDQRPRAWQIGMTPVHQQCDLSVRWMLDADGLPLGASSSDTPRAAANSLGDLTMPHNRFAHVRAPNSALVGFGSPGYNGFTTMPILAVESQLPPMMNPAATSSDSNGNTATVDTYLPTHTGFLRPEFALGMDYTHTEVPGGYWGRERVGADILNSEILGFDIQAYDRLAPVVYSPGPDGAPGTGGMDDNADGRTDNAAEYGSPNSDDLVVGASAPMFFAIARQPGTAALAARGDFVDLAFERLAGGTVRSLASPLKATLSSTTATAPTSSRVGQLFTSQFSAYRASSDNPGSIPTSLYKSGKVVLNSGGDVVVFQPTYDTFTTRYERDGFLQSDANGLSYPSHSGTVWWAPHSSLTAIDLGANGVDNNPAVILGVDDASEQETAAPFEAPLSSFRIRIRLQDDESGTVVQRSVVGNGRQ